MATTQTAEADDAQSNYSTDWYVRCTTKDCDYADVMTRRKARQHQKRFPCPGCNSGVAIGRMAEAAAELRARARSDDGPTPVEPRI